MIAINDRKSETTGVSPRQGDVFRGRGDETAKEFVRRSFDERIVSWYRGNTEGLVHKTALTLGLVSVWGERDHILAAASVKTRH